MLSIRMSAPSLSIVGQPYVAEATIVGGFAAGGYTTTSTALPPGLGLDPYNGSLSGVPTAAGNFGPITVTVSDTHGNIASSDPFSIYVSPATASLLTSSPVRAGTAIFGNLSSSLANPVWSFAQTPVSPGLSLSGSGFSFSGTAPAVLSATAFSITAAATDNNTTVATAPMALTVLPQLAIAGAPEGLQNAVVGNAFGPTTAPTASGVAGNGSYSLVQFGSPFDIASACPGLAFAPATGQIAGTPTAPCAVDNLAIRLSDDFDGDAVDSAPGFGITTAADVATAALTSPATVRAGAAVTGSLSTNLAAPAWTFASQPASPALALAAYTRARTQDVLSATLRDVSLRKIKGFSVDKSIHVKLTDATIHRLALQPSQDGRCHSLAGRARYNINGLQLFSHRHDRAEACDTDGIERHEAKLDVVSDPRGECHDPLRRVSEAPKRRLFRRHKKQRQCP